MTDKMTHDEVLAALNEAAKYINSETVPTRKVIATISALYDEVEAQQRWIAHLCAFIGPGAMPGLRASFEAGQPAGGADQRANHVDRPSGSS